MRKMILCNLLCIFLLSGGSSIQGQDLINRWPGLNYGGYDVGYQVFLKNDNSRSFCRKVDYYGKKVSLTNRQIQIHIWYPANAPADAKPLLYKEYILSSLLLRENQNNLDDFLCKTILSDYKTEMVNSGAEERFIDQIFSSTTHAYYSAPWADGHFPLILYAPSINSNPYENSVLIEFLVSYGFVVVSCPSVGLHSPGVTRDWRGLSAQFEDLRFILSEAWEYPQIDHEKIGTIGFSWGGMSNVQLALDNYNIDAVVSLDGAVGMPEYLTLLKQTTQFNINNMTANYLQIVPSLPKRTFEFFEMLKYCDASLIKINKVKHKDFCSDYLLKNIFGFPFDKEKDTAFYSIFYNRLSGIILQFLEKKLTEKKGNTNDNEIDLFIKEYCETVKKDKLRPPPTEEEFLEMITTRGVDYSCKVFYGIREKDTTAIFFSEASILKYATEWGPEKANELIQLLNMNLVVYPESFESLYWLAQCYLVKQEKEKAISHLQKCILIEPGFIKAEKLLTSLQSESGKN